MNTVFGLDIQQVYYPGDKSILADIIANLDPKVGKATLPHDAAVGGTSTTYGSLKNFEIPKELSDFITKEAQAYWTHLGYSSQLTPYILQVWGNCSTPGSSWSLHNHSPAPMSGVFYLNSSPTMGNLIFEHPLETILACQPYEFDFLLKKWDFEVECEAGKLVLWPGWLKHKTMPNMDTENRYALGFNIGCQGQVNYIHLI